MKQNIYVYILVMAIVTYLIRMLPFAIIRGNIKSKFFKSFLYYVPYVSISVMTFPAILNSTASIYSALAGFIVAVILAFCKRSMITVSLSACAVVYLIEIFI